MLEDDNFAQEVKKYKNPIPSRQFILKVLKNKPLKKKQLIKHLKLNETQYKALSFRLSAMVRDKELNCNREGFFRIYKNNSSMVGKVIANPKGFGFVELNAKTKDLRLSKQQMQFVFHGEKVSVRLLGHKDSPLDAEVVKVIERIKTLVGKIVVKNDKCYLLVDDKRIFQQILLPQEKVKNNKKSKIVIVEMMTYPQKEKLATARVISILGDYLSEGVEVDSAIHRYQIPNEFNKKVQKEMEKIPDKVLEKDKKGRVDLTNLAFVTIDGADSKDFDDAVLAQKTQTGYKLFVAIADVAHYVNEGSALDKEAIERGNSVYFPNRVIPMLPEGISNGLCSLNPEVKRLCLVCEMDISNQGEVNDYQFYEAVMFSKARLTYEQVDDYIYHNKNLPTKNKEVLKNIKHLNDLYKILNKKRIKDGSIEFDLSESQIIFNNQLKIDKVIKKSRLNSYKLIEECMLVANQMAATYLEKNQIPALYRVHPKPKVEKVISSNEFLKTFGLTLPTNNNYSTQDFQKVFEDSKKLPNHHIIQVVLLRTMQQAIYTDKNEGHFGLGFEKYAHFTSPIRRYPDLIIHRAIKQTLKNKSFKVKNLSSIGEHCSMTERRADEASRDVMQFLKCVYIKDKVGDVFSGSITSVTAFGLFIELDELLIEGLAHIKDIANDYFVFNEKTFQLIGKRTNKTYSLAQKIKVQLSAVNLEQRKIDLLIK